MTNDSKAADRRFDLVLTFFILGSSGFILDIFYHITAKNAIFLYFLLKINANRLALNVQIDYALICAQDKVDNAAWLHYTKSQRITRQDAVFAYLRVA